MPHTAPIVIHCGTPVPPRVSHAPCAGMARRSAIRHFVNARRSFLGQTSDSLRLASALFSPPAGHVPGRTRFAVFIRSALVYVTVRGTRSEMGDPAQFALRMISHALAVFFRRRRRSGTRQRKSRRRPLRAPSGEASHPSLVCPSSDLNAANTSASETAPEEPG